MVNGERNIEVQKTGGSVEFEEIERDEEALGITEESRQQFQEKVQRFGSAENIPEEELRSEKVSATTRQQQKKQQQAEKEKQAQQEAQEQAQKEQELTDLEQFAIQQGVSPPRTQKQREILRQVRDVQRMEEGGFTPAEREIAQLGQQQIRAAEVQEQAQETQELLEEAPPGTEFVLTRDGEETVIDTEQEREAEIQRQQSVERQAAAALGDLEAAQDVLREQAEQQRKSDVDLAIDFGQGIITQGAVGVEGLTEEVVKGVSVIDEQTIEDAIGGPGQADPQEAFEQNLPVLTEVQRRSVGLVQDIEERVPEPVEEAGVEFFDEFLMATNPSAEPILRTVPEEIREEAIRTLPEATAEEIPEKLTEPTTLLGIGVETIQDPQNIAEDIITGGPEFARRVVEEPIEFGFGETVPDIGLDLLTGGGIIMAQPQVQQQVQQQTDAMTDFLEGPGQVRTRKGTVDVAPGGAVPDVGPALPGTEPRPEPEPQTDPQVEVEQALDQAVAGPTATAQATAAPVLSTFDDAMAGVFDEPTAQDLAQPQQQVQEQAQPQAVPVAQALTLEQAIAEEAVQARPQTQPQEQAQPQPVVSLFDLPEDETVNGEDDFETLFIGSEQDTEPETSLIGEFFGVVEEEPREEFTGLGIRGRPARKGNNVEKELQSLF